MYISAVILQTKSNCSRDCFVFSSFILLSMTISVKSKQENEQNTPYMVTICYIAL